MPGLLAFIGGGALTFSLLALAAVPSGEDVSRSTVSLLLSALGLLLGGTMAVVGLIIWVRSSTRNPRILGWAGPLALILTGASGGIYFATGGLLLPFVLFGASILCLLFALVARQRHLPMSGR